MTRARVAGRLRQPSAPVDQVLVNLIALSPYSGDEWRNRPGAERNRHAVAARREAEYLRMIRRPLVQSLSQVIPFSRDSVRGEVRRHAGPFRPIR